MVKGKILASAAIYICRMDLTVLVNGMHLTEEVAENSF